MSERVFVTGGTGFIGSHIVDALVEGGRDVTVLARKSSSRANLTMALESGRVRLIQGDITDPGSLRGSMEDMEVLIHGAALSRDWGDRADFRSINISGTINVLEEAIRSGVGHIIHISTCGVIGEEDCIDPKSEESPIRPHLPYLFHRVFPSAMNYYRETKGEGEAKAIEICKGNVVGLTVIRPVWVFGERELHSGPYITARAGLKGPALIPGRGSTLFHMVYVRDLAKMITKLSEWKGNGIRTFMAGPERPVPLEEYHGDLFKIIGSRDPVYLPKILTYPVGLIMEFLSAILRSDSPPLLTRARVSMGFNNNIYDTSKLRSELGTLPCTSLKTGLNRSVRWWRENGYL